GQDHVPKLGARTSRGEYGALLEISFGFLCSHIISARGCEGSYVQQRRASDSSKKLSGLSSTWRNWPHVLAYLRSNATLGQIHQGSRRDAKNAAVVCRSQHRT